MMARAVLAGLTLVAVACASEPRRLVLELRGAGDPTLLEGVDTFVLSVEDRDGRPLVLRRGAPSGQIRLDDVPHGSQLTFRLEGLFRETPIVRGQTCPTDVLPDRPLPVLSMFVSRAGSFSRVADPPGEVRGDPMVFIRADGVVVMAGGRDPRGQALATAVTFDPRAGTWSSERPLVGARAGGAVALLDEGQRAVLVGGEDEGGGAVDRLELYHPASGFAVVSGTMGFGGAGVAAISLPDGRVLVTGGAARGQRARADAALFGGDHGNTLVPAGATAVARRAHRLSVVGTGAFSAAFAIGGDGGEGQATTSAIETYNPRASSAPFTLEAAHLAEARADHTATTLRTGEILVVGGRGTDRPLASAEIFDPITRTVAPAGLLGHARMGHTATLLHDGRVLITGGLGEAGQPLRSAELFDPTSRTFAAARPLSVERADHVAVELCDGVVLVVGGGPGAEIYNPAR